MYDPPPGMPLYAHWVNIAKLVINLDPLQISFDYKNTTFN